jgi:N-acetylglucosaminyldiphosphoundecaprenol N-acetyl-beta-D-mannosaminyltransferase
MITLTCGRATVSGAKETTLETYGLFGISFCVVPKEVMANDIRLRARDNVPSSVILANAHVIVEAQKDPQLKNAIANASLVIPDGMPVTWVLRGKGQKFVERYPGPDLMEDILRLERSAAHYLLGSTPDVLGRIDSKFKGSVTGSYSPPFTNNGFTEQEKCRQLELIEKRRPDFIWVGLGAPRQEAYVTEMAFRSSRGVWLGVGAAFDFHAGIKRRAPQFLQKAGLEWAFRLITEPRRLGPRYLATNPVFIKLACQELIGRQSHGAADHDRTA